MCRFVIYLGTVPTLLHDVLGKPNNSLIDQSFHARKIEVPINADGFGIGWYQHDIDEYPAKFKSTQPAWNDNNLQSMSKKIMSDCFIGHVRRSTMGDVNRSNCHPFSLKQHLFCHNGGIEDFMAIQRHLRRLLSDDLYHNIIGQTDSEHFFALLMNHFLTLDNESFLDNAFESFKVTAETVVQLQRKYAKSELSELNTVLTNGHEVMATRYRSNENQKALSLYYTEGTRITTEGNHPIVEYDIEKPNALVIASEPLSDYAGEWREVPPNHAILVNRDLKVECRNLDD